MTVPSTGGGTLKVSATVVTPNYVLRVVEGSSPPKANGERELQVGLDLLRLDAQAGVLGESLASLLIPAVEFDEELRPLVESYRRRIVVEEAAELAARLGPATRRVLVPPEYFPAARMSRHAQTHSCLFNLSPGQLKAVGEGYRNYLSDVGDIRDDGVIISPRKVRGSMVSVLTSALKTTLSSLGAAGLYLWLSQRSCSPSRALLDPLGLLEPEEGVLLGRCDAIQAIKEIIVGDGTCRRSSILFSTQVCEGGGSSIVIKDYSYAIPKWLLAGLISIGAYPFRQTPSSRASNEYSHFISMRAVIRTPRVYSLCLSPVSATMVREYVDGDVVMKSDDPEIWRRAGEALARIHRAGFALGDPNPGNFVLSGQETWLIDAEQAATFNPTKGAWDLAVYYYYARFFGAPADLVRESVTGYASAAGDLWRKVKDEFFSPRMAPFLVSLPPLLIELVETLRRVPSP